ncbi:MAG: hypothetical protein VB093_13135 [Propionicimonas sp.]|nr:hypothetical protein [Propionicimonas sp.]
MPEPGAAEPAGRDPDARQPRNGPGRPARWQASLAYALTGADLELSEPGRPDPPALIAGLAAQGWTPARLRAHAEACVRDGQSWPHLIPPDLRAGCGAAQLAAVLGSARALLGLVTLETRPPSARTTFTADELRLLREVPPHHGS